MRCKLLIVVLILCGLSCRGEVNGKSGSLFATSKCFDLLASLQNFDQMKDEPQFASLSSDSIFVRALRRVKDNVRASKLCNFYASFHGNKHDIDSCVAFFAMLPGNYEVINSDADWIKNILSLQKELSLCLTAIKDAGYSDYWHSVVKPGLDRYIASYPVSETLLDSIHSALSEFSGPETFSESHSNTYVMNIDNAFNLSDESFCCTPLLLDPEMEKRFRLDFIKVYIHENLHRLNVSGTLMNKLDELMEDDFYRENEKIAWTHNEGKNEAFVVASEVYISHKLGRRDARSVYDEFKEYVDGSLVLAPIVYVHLDEKRGDESLNDFVLRLFDSKVIRVGHIKEEYEKAMTQLESK